MRLTSSKLCAVSATACVGCEATVNNNVADVVRHVRLRPTSLRGRLVLGAVGVGLVFALLFGSAAAWRIHHAADQAIGAALQSRLELARTEVAPDGSLRTDPAGPKSDLVQIVDADGMVLTSSPGLRGLGPLTTATALGSARLGERGTVSFSTPDVDLATLAVPWRVIKGGGVVEPVTLVVALDTEGFTTANDTLTGLLMVGLGVVILVLALLSWVVTGRTLRRVHGLTESAERVGAGGRQDGMQVPKGDAELGRLVLALNRMVARLHANHLAELAFAANAGHRLRTPVATLRAEAELALLDPDPGRRTSALKQIIADADRLTLIVDRMLARGRPGAQEEVSLPQLLDDTTPRWRRQARFARVDLLVLLPSTNRPRRVPGHDLIDILDPIIDNAIRHTPPSGNIRIEVGPSPSDQLVVEVSNTGSSVPADLAPHIFDAWVSTRAGSEAGGLGLWVARETARDLGGDVLLVTGFPGSTRFRVSLPVPG